MEELYLWQLREAAGEEPHWVYTIHMVHASAIVTVNNVSPALESLQTFFIFEKVQSNI